MSPMSSSLMNRLFCRLLGKFEIYINSFRPLEIKTQLGYHSDLERLIVSPNLGP